MTKRSNKCSRLGSKERRNCSTDVVSGATDAKGVCTLGVKTFVVSLKATLDEESTVVGDGEREGEVVFCVFSVSLAST